MADRQEPQEIVIEICQNCKQHNWCTRHDQSRYESTFAACASAIQSQCGLTVTKNKDIPAPQIGAFEVSCNGVLIFSKIKTGLWPVPTQLAQRVQMFIDDYKGGKDVTKYVNIKDQKYVPPPKKKPQTQYGYMQFEESPQKKKVEGGEEQQQQQQAQNESQQEDMGQNQEEFQNTSQVQETTQQQKHVEVQEQKNAEEEQGNKEQQQETQEQKNENQNGDQVEQQA